MNFKSNQRSFEEFQNVMISRETLPPFSAADPNKPLENIFYAFIKTNESFKKINETYGNIKLDGTYVGVGFGASFHALIQFMDIKFDGAYFCEREPYVYIMGKMLLRLIPIVDSALELFLHLVDYESFYHAFIRTIHDEPEQSPVFLRVNKEEFLRKIPSGFDYLRKTVFNTMRDPLTSKEEELFSPKSSSSIEEKITWLDAFLKTRSTVAIRQFSYKFKRLKKQIQNNKITALCVDFFNPALWQSFAQKEEIWQKPSMIYLSNAAIYSTGLTVQSEKFSISNVYRPKLFEKIPGSKEGRHYYLYSEQLERYHVIGLKQPPTLREVLASFEPRMNESLESALARIEVE